MNLNHLLRSRYTVNKTYLKVTILLFLAFTIIFTSGYKLKERKFTRGVIFNDVPFSPATAGNYKKSFLRGEPIYWLFMSKKKIEASFLGIQVVSAAHKSGFMTITGIVYSHDYRVNRDNPFYYTDYFVIHSPGHYYLQVFDKNQRIKPLAVGDFYVK